MDVTDYLGNSDYLKADDIGRSRPRVTVGEVHLKEFTESDGATKQKLVLMFKGKDKGMVLNITNTKRMAESYGKDSDAWIGKEIELYSEDTPMGPGLRLTPEPADFSDDIPF